MIYVGLDVSLNAVAICVVDDAGRIIREGTTSADAAVDRALYRTTSRSGRKGWPRGRTDL